MGTCCVCPLRVHAAGVSRNLVLRFKDDTIDDSIELAQLLQSSAAISSRLDLSLRTLEGDHIRPMAPVSSQAGLVANQLWQRAFVSFINAASASAYQV
jgi:hypothetical protein